MVESEILFCSTLVMSNDPLLQATLQLSEELFCRRPEERSIDDIQRILPWIRHRSSLFKNLEDGKCMAGLTLSTDSFYIDLI